MPRGFTRAAQRAGWEARAARADKRATNLAPILAELRAFASGSEFRTAPLWGLGQRIFFLHDGRTNDLNVTILQHVGNGSEANAVIRNYNMLKSGDKQSLLNYLRSL
jgi:CxxC motif-containing protein (DUF1111 family)